MMRNLNFKLSDAPVFKDNPELLAIPEFSKLTDRQMRYVMLCDWYGSPLRLMKAEDRKHKAAILAGYKLEKDGKRLDINGRNVIEGKVATIEQARKMMQEIQYDLEMDIKEALDMQIDEIVGFFRMQGKNLQQLEKAVTMMTKLSTILETRKKILELLNFRANDIVEEAIEEEKQELSFLDELNETI